MHPLLSFSYLSLVFSFISVGVCLHGVSDLFHADIHAEKRGPSSLCRADPLACLHEVKRRDIRLETHATGHSSTRYNVTSTRSWHNPLNKTSTRTDRVASLASSLTPTTNPISSSSNKYGALYPTGNSTGSLRHPTSPGSAPRSRSTQTTVSATSAPMNTTAIMVTATNKTVSSFRSPSMTPRKPLNSTLTSVPITNSSVMSKVSSSLGNGSISSTRPSISPTRISNSSVFHSSTTNSFSPSSGFSIFTKIISSNRTSFGLPTGGLNISKLSSSNSSRTTTPSQTRLHVNGTSKPGGNNGGIFPPVIPAVIGFPAGGFLSPGSPGGSDSENDSDDQDDHKSFSVPSLSISFPPSTSRMTASTTSAASSTQITSMPANSTMTSTARSSTFITSAANSTQITSTPTNSTMTSTASRANSTTQRTTMMPNSTTSFVSSTPSMTNSTTVPRNTSMPQNASFVLIDVRPDYSESHAKAAAQQFDSLNRMPTRDLTFEFLADLTGRILGGSANGSVAGNIAQSAPQDSMSAKSTEEATGTVSVSSNIAGGSQSSDQSVFSSTVPQTTSTPSTSPSSTSLPPSTSLVSSASGTPTPTPPPGGYARCGQSVTDASRCPPNCPYKEALVDPGTGGPIIHDGACVYLRSVVTSYTAR